jgi:hypothetical protein
MSVLELKQLLGHKKSTAFVQKKQSITFVQP